MYIDAASIAGKIVVWSRDKDGILRTDVEPSPYYCYHASKDGQYKTIFNHAVEKLEFDSKYEYKNYIENHNMVFEADITPLQKFLSDNFYKIDGPVNKAYFDIETDFDLSQNRGYPTIEDPFGRINSISMFNDATKEYHMFMLTDVKIVLSDTHENLPVHCHCVNTERELLDAFIAAIEDVDVISAWNGQNFDIPYLLARCERVYGPDEGPTKLCREGLKVDYREYTNEWGYDAIKYILVGRTHLDLMEIYKKFTRETHGEIPSYRLDVIAEKELNMNKLTFAGDLGELYRTNPQEFFEYSLHDARLLKLLDEKLKFLNLAITMARRATIRFDEVLGSIRYLEMAIRNYCHFDRPAEGKEMLILPDRLTNEKSTFEGAFVMEPKVGVYGYTASVDISGLYPSVIRALNISPETHVWQCKRGNKDFLEIVQQTDKMITMKCMEDGEEIRSSAKEIHEIMRKENWSLSANGSFFDNSRQGIIPEVLGVWIEQREEVKNLHKYYAKEVENIQKVINARKNKILP